ncbi:hypothetical protein QFC22_000310 [Naganishia vaughanmartiniae]|uniref:Uncharacterized protein n=1 Tax=Naganishia vaughanmartiniae TaxID=1424756 RepID=A0ACC2XMQ8_9TREE|nr:hypothetical protein QFC22_000310 [Naganishia vaughanmartiniae]
MAPFQNNKKRSAPTSGSSAQAKKPRVNDTKSKQNFKDVKGKGKAPSATKKPIKSNRNTEEKSAVAPKRKQPLTAVRVPQENDEEDDGEMDVDESEDTSEDVEMSANVVEAGPPREAERLALHATQPHRTTKLPSHPLLQEKLLPLWEEARKADITKEERQAAIKQLWQAVKGRVGEVARGHKGGRVLQTIVKYGGKEERDGVASELEGQYKTMMQSKYSKFLMSKLIRHSHTVRPKIIAEITPDVPQLLFHSHACGPLADFFELYASPKEKRLLVRGFYPKEVLLFDGVGVGKEAAVNVVEKAQEKGKEASEVKNLEKVLEGMTEGKMRERVLEEMNEKVVHVFNSTQKEALAQEIFHRVVLEYLTCVYKFLSAEEADKKMHDLLESSLESLPDIIHTRDGSAVVREFLARGIAKDRKNILRVLKPHLEKICKDGEAQTVLFTAFDVVDDTKMMGKAIIADIGQMAGDLALDKHGRKVLFYLIAPRSTRHFIPSTIAQLKQSDESAAKTSKKDKDIRRKELKAVMSPDLLKLVEDQGEQLLRDTGASILVTEILLSADGGKTDSEWVKFERRLTNILTIDKLKALEAIAQPLSTPYPNPAPAESDPDPATSHILDLGYAVRAYKTLLAGGRFSTTTNAVEEQDADLQSRFAQLFFDNITSPETGGAQNLVNIALGNATFALVELLSALQKDKTRIGTIKQTLCVPDVLLSIESGWRKGAKPLYEALSKL